MNIKFISMMKRYLLVSFLFFYVINISFSDEIDNFSNELSKNNSKLGEMSKKIQTALKSGDLSNIQKEIQKLYHSTINASNNKNSIKQNKNNPTSKKNINKISSTILKTFQNKSESEVSTLLAKILEKKPMSKYTRSGTKFNLFLTKIVRDNQALPMFLSLSYKRDRLKTLGLFSLSTILINFILKLFLRKSKFFKKYILRWSFIYCLRIGLIVHFIGVELSPTWNIFLKVFFPNDT